MPVDRQVQVPDSYACKPVASAAKETLADSNRAAMVPRLLLLLLLLLPSDARENILFEPSTKKRCKIIEVERQSN